MLSLKKKVSFDIMNHYIISSYQTLFITESDKSSSQISSILILIKERKINFFNNYLSTGECEHLIFLTKVFWLYLMKS